MVALVVGCAGVGVGAWIVKASMPRPVVPPVESAEGDADAQRLLGKEVDQLKRELVRFKLEKLSDRAAAAKTAEAVSASETPAVPAPRTPEERAARAKESAERWKHQLDVTFEGQHRDGDWALDAERKAQAAVSAVGPGVTLRSATCAETMCRIVINNQDAAQQQDLARALADKEPFASGSAFDQEGLTTIVYVTRAGQTLPHLDQ